MKNHYLMPMKYEFELFIVKIIRNDVKILSNTHNSRIKMNYLNLRDLSAFFLPSKFSAVIKKIQLGYERPRITPFLSLEMSPPYIYAWEN